MNAKRKKPLMRAVFVTTAIGSLIPFALLVGLHIRSFFVSDEIGFIDSNHRAMKVAIARPGICASVAVLSSTGIFEVEAQGHTAFWRRSASASGTDDYSVRLPPGFHSVHFRGFRSWTGDIGYGETYLVLLRFWLIEVTAAIPPVAFFVSYYVLAARRRQLGLCPRCGYDIRANPTRCSECGFQLAKGRDSRDNPI